MPKRKLLFVVVLLIIVVGIVAYSVVFKSRSDAVASKPDYSLTVKELLDAFEKDTAAANRQYADKIIAVTGTVQRIDTAGAVVLGENGSPSEVVLALDRTYHRDDYQKLAVGKIADLQGIYSGYQSSESDPNDLLSGLGATVQLRSAGIKSNQ